MKLTKSDTVAKIVTTNIESASIFNEYGINFYSKGNMTLEEACNDGKVPITSLVEDLSQLEAISTRPKHFAEMSTKRLSDLILLRHHRFAEKKLIFIKHTLAKTIHTNESEQANLQLIKNAFEKLSEYLVAHMQYQEEIVFPVITMMGGQKAISPSSFMILIKPLGSLGREIEKELENLRIVVRAARNGCIKPENRSIYATINDATMVLENDLKVHMHLENNILFPKVLDLAQTAKRNFDQDIYQSPKGSILSTHLSI